MPLHHYIEKYFQQHPQDRIEGIKTENPPMEKRPKVFHVENQLIETPTHTIPIRIYIPDETPTKYYPLFVFIHGSDFVRGNLDSHDVCCRLISSLSGYKVIAVDYRFDSSFDDCYTATKWVYEHAQQLGGIQTDVVVGGPSAGGYLATMIVLTSMKTEDFSVAKQILHYPIIDLDPSVNNDYFSRQLYNAKYGIDITSYHTHLLRDDQETLPFQSPIFASPEYLSKMPRTLIFTAEYDPYCDEAEMYAQKLKEAGVNVKHVHFDGDIHGFLQSFPGSPDYMRGYEVTAEFLIEE